MKNKSLIIAVFIIGLFLGLFLYLKSEVKTAEQSDSATAQIASDSEQFRVTPIESSTLIKSHSPIKGPFSAKVTLVEFLDPECESCAAMYPHVKKVSKEFEKDLRVDVRYMTFHGNSKYVANILEGTRAQNKYWEALELLFATQNKWANHHNPQPELIPEILKPLGLNMDKIIADAKSGKYDQQITEDMEDGRKAGVRGTPTFFVNGRMLEELGYESLRSSIQSKISKE